MEVCMFCSVLLVIMNLQNAKNVTVMFTSSLLVNASTPKMKLNQFSFLQLNSSKSTSLREWNTLCRNRKVRIRWLDNSKALISNINFWILNFKRTFFKCATFYNREPETWQNARPFRSIMAERQRYGCIDLEKWPYSCKQIPTLWSPSTS